MSDEGLMERPRKRKEKPKELERVVETMESATKTVKTEQETMKAETEGISYHPPSEEEHYASMREYIREAVRAGNRYSDLGISKGTLRRYGFEVGWTGKITETGESAQLEALAGAVPHDLDGDGIVDVVRLKNGYELVRRGYEEETQREKGKTAGEKFEEAKPQVDIERFYKIATDSELSDELRVQALNELGDDELRKIVLETPSVSIRTKALERIRDNKLLGNIILRAIIDGKPGITDKILEYNWRVRRELLERLDTEQLNRIRNTSGFTFSNDFYETLSAIIKSKKELEAKEALGLLLPDAVQRVPNDYIQVPQHGIFVPLRETHFGKDLYKTLDDVASEGLFVPNPAEFMTHWMNVREAANGKRQLVYADGTPVSGDAAKDLWNYMSSTDRSKWNGKPCWTWLSALFRNKDGKQYIETDLEVKTDANGNKILQGKSEPLDTCLKKVAWASLKFNKQGLATETSSLRGYRQGDNLCFGHPINDCVVRFVASSSRVSLDCYGNPLDSYASLGVFASGRSPRSALKK